MLAFLTNDFSRLSGVVACLYFRGWEEEKCFDIWNNDFAQAKAWGKARVAIANQAHLAIITHLLLGVRLQTRLGPEVSRQVLRFFKLCFLKPASPALYERELRPLLATYL